MFVDLGKILVVGMVVLGLVSIGYGMSVLWPYAGTAEFDPILREFGLPKTITDGALLILGGVVLGLLAMRASSSAKSRERI